MSAAVASGVTVACAAIFFLALVATTLPAMLNESGPRKVIGVEVDSGSHLWDLVGGTLSVVAACALILGAILYTAFSALSREVPGWAAFWKRFTA